MLLPVDNVEYRESILSPVSPDPGFRMVRLLPQVHLSPCGILALLIQPAGLAPRSQDAVVSPVDVYKVRGRGSVSLHTEISPSSLTTLSKSEVQWMRGVGPPEAQSCK